MAANLILCGYLGICSCYDCKTKRIPGWLLGTGLVAGLIYAFVLLCTGEIAWQDMLAGAAPGAVMLVYGRATDKKLGTADGLMAIPAGLMQQWERCTAELMAACLFTFFFALVLLLTKKGNRDTQIPFAPFFLAAVAVLWMGDIWKGMRCG